MAFNRQPAAKPAAKPAAGGSGSRVLITALFLMALSPLRAQNFDYYMELHFIQRLTWIGDEYALRYEVIIEKEEEGKYNRVLQEFAEADFINISLSPGRYRYQIIPYDFLDQPVPATEWTDFEILSGNANLETGEHEVIIVNPSDATNRTKIILAVPKAEAFPEETTADAIPEEHDAPSLPVRPAEPPPPAAQPQTADTARLNTIGVSVGAASAAPVFVATVQGTYAPWKRSFFELGMDIGLGSGKAKAGHFSLYPYARYAFFAPFAKGGQDAKGGWHAGAGGGLMIATYTFPSEGKITGYFPAADVSAGFILGNGITVSYSLRTDFSTVVNSRLSVGWSYRFK